MSPTLDRVIDIVAERTGTRRDWLSADSAIDQEIGIAGGDVEDLAQALAAEFGEYVWQWPWQRFAILDEGLPLSAIFWLPWQLVTWPFRGTFSCPSPFERLELGHIAKVLDAGHWLEP